MLLYISSNQNIGIFDFLIKEKGFIIKKLSGEFYLNKFVVHDMRNLSHYSYIAIDLKSLKDTNEEIIEALRAFKVMYDSRIIVFAEGRAKEKSLIKDLIDEKIYNIVTATSIAAIKDQILKCISDEGMTYDEFFISDSNTSEVISQYIFKQKDIKVAVVGVTRKVGTTTAAFNLTNYLNSIGARVSYTEANYNNHLKDIADYYEFIKDDEKSYKYSGIEYYTDKQFPNEYNFNVFDLGVLNTSTISIFKTCEVRILCSTAKPYELAPLKEALNIKEGIHTCTLFSFVPEPSRIRLKKLIESENNRVFFTGYSPSLFDGKVNKKIFREVLKDYIIEI